MSSDPPTRTRAPYVLAYGSRYQLLPVYYQYILTHNKGQSQTHCMSLGRRSAGRSWVWVHINMDRS